MQGLISSKFQKFQTLLRLWQVLWYQLHLYCLHFELYTVDFMQDLDSAVLYISSDLGKKALMLKLKQKVSVKSLYWAKPFWAACRFRQVIICVSKLHPLILDVKVV